MADDEVARLEQKRARGDVLDPIALTDPLGQSVERVIMRVGVTVVAILIVGILLAQVACKNIQLAAIPDLSTGVNETAVENALSHGISWSGEIVRFPSTEAGGIEDGTATVVATATGPRSIEVVVSDAIARSTALSMNAFRDPDLERLVYIVNTHISEEDGSFSTSGGDPVGEAFRVIWERSAQDGAQLSMSVEGEAVKEILEGKAEEVDETPGVQLGQ